MTNLPPVLDACCGSRMFWFDRHDGRALYIDHRIGMKVYKDYKPIHVKPDQIADFRSLPFRDETFWHVVFDPPHFHKGAGKTGIIAFKYGLLAETWPDDLRQGFAECFRVLRPHGTLIFKWSDVEIPLYKILALTPEKPLYGHRSGKRAKTHWVAFLKANNKIKE